MEVSFDDKKVMPKEKGLTSKNNVVAVVLHFNSPESLVNVVAAIESQTVKVKNIIVVDNASAAHSALRIESPSVRLVSLSSNKGVGAGHNIGWRLAVEQYDAEFVWALEHDAIPKPDCLEQLLMHYSPSDLMAMCPVEDNGLEFEKRNYYTFHSTGFRKLTDKKKNSLYRGGLSFNGLLLPVRILSEVGYLNEAFFIGREDLEFYKRIYKKQGYVLRIPSAHVFHNLYKEKKQIRVFNTMILFPEQSIVREFYSYRNSIYMQKMQGAPVWKLYIRHLIGILITVLFRNSKFERIRNRTLAFKNGMNGILGK
jgi:GT2 family glycosyltransferase